MEKTRKTLKNECSMSGIRPAVLELPYPPIEVMCRNRDYADMLQYDYCGSVSELSAITQYINNENRMCLTDCRFARTILGIAMAEMMHLQKLGELICLLGGEVETYMTEEDIRRLAAYVEGQRKTCHVDTGLPDAGPE